MSLDYKLISEFGLNDTILVLEPERKCVCRCTWCFPELNRRAAKWAGKSRKLEGPETFARHANRAFGPDYDPTSFPEWALRHKLPFTWASGVEPWQDVEQARGVFDVVDRLDLAAFVQTRGTNWRGVWDRMRARADAGQVALYVSMPSDDPAYVKRYEPGTPTLDDRWALIDAAVAAGIPTMLAVAPYHPDWCPDLAGLVARAIARGVRAVLFDELHLTRRQLDAAGDRTLPGLCEGGWSARTIDAARAAKALCVASGVGWWATNFEAPVYRLESVDPFGWLRYRDATPFPYHEESLFGTLNALSAGDDAPPLVVTWDEAVAEVESESSIRQPFSWSSFGHEILSLKKLPAAWRDSLKPAATLAAYLRALWDDPHNNQVFWRHPFARVAVDPASGSPRLSPSGDAVMVFDPNFAGTDLRRPVDDLDAPPFVRFTHRGQRPWSTAARRGPIAAASRARADRPAPGASPPDSSSSNPPGRAGRP